MVKVYAEVGIGNETFLSTEFEDGVGEYRVPGFKIPDKIDDVYLRLWLGGRKYILSTKDGFKTDRKDRNRFKLLFGIGGVS